eukprot:1151837_1
MSSTILFLVLFPVIHGQIQIWYEKMNTSSTSWSGNPSLSIETSNALCPTPNMYCWAFASGLSTKRTDNTTQFTAVQLVYAISGSNLNDQDRCVIEYSTDGTTFYDLERVAIATAGITNTFTGADLQPTLTIQLSSMNGSGHELTLQGIPVTEASVPTSSPLTSNPTKAPTYASPVITSCNNGTERLCYYVDIDPLVGVVQLRLIAIQDVDHGNMETWITPSSNHCVDPSITLTYERIDCGTYRDCYSVDVVPLPFQLTSTPIVIQGPFVSATNTYFAITFNIFGAVTCRDPSIDLRFERIDTDTIGERHLHHLPPTTAHTQPSIDHTKNSTQTPTEPTAIPSKTPTGHTCATLWDAIPSPFNLTNVSHHLNNWLPHGLCSGSYSNQYIMANIPTESCSDALIEHEVHSLHNEFKETQLTSDLLRVLEPTKDKPEASFTTIPNPMRRIISVCTNSTISSAKSHSQNRISLRIVNKHETIDTVYYASDITIGTEQHMRCLMVVLMLMFIMCKCPKSISFNTVILMMVSGVFGYEYCNTAYECVGQSRPINRADSFYSRGYKANSGGATDITIEWVSSYKSIVCGGSFSCANIGYIKGSSTSDSSYLSCDGVFGCSNTFVNLTGIERSCSGSNSCYGVTFHSYGVYTFEGHDGPVFGSIDCDADRSCSNTEIHNHNHISARGSYAMNNATIHSTADGFDVYLYGSNTGFGAAIFCQLGHSCTIYCSATGCNMLYVDCVGNCSIQSNSVDTVLPITEYSLFDESQLNILYDSSALAKSNDADCLLMFDDYYENANANISGTNVCCRGSWSCDGSSIYSATSVVCSGEESCQSSDNITANDAIFCSASRGCWWSNLYSLNDVYCLSSMACYDTTITARNLYCSGYKSCSESTILNTETIYFSGSGSGNGAVINCTDIALCNIICGGYLSCSSIASIHCNECTVSCDRDTGCPPGYTYAPTSDPTPSPTSHPTHIPTMIPTYLPTHPTPSPSTHPTHIPTMIPTYLPTHEPTRSPTVNPTIAPTNPSTIPTLSPIIPTSSPTSHPTPIPTMIPTSLPTHEPTVNPTAHPTIAPTSPSTIPTLNPTLTPTSHPTHAPTMLTTDNIMIANHKDISDWMIAFYVLNVDTTCDGSIIDIAITDRLNYKDKWIHFEQYEYKRNGEAVILHQDAVFTAPISIRITRSDNIRNETLIGYDIITSFTQSMRFDFGSNACVDSDVWVVNITLVAITEIDNTTQLIKDIEDSTMDILTARYDYTALDTDVLITNTSVDDGEDTSVFTYTFSVTITLNSTTAIDQIEIETDLTEGFDEYNLNINIEVYVVSDDATSPRTSSQSDDTDLDDILNYIQRRFEDLTTLELIIGISGIVVICCCIPLCICCLCRHCKNRRRIDDSRDADQVKKPELRDDNTLTPHVVRVHDSSIALPEDRHVNTRGNDKDKEEGRKY